jgi:hypothetical protein
MGIDAGDFDNDGDEDLFITELTGQGHDLYVNDGTATFEDRSARAGIRLPSLAYTGFGAGWFDIDNDGWLDVLTVNGAVTQNVESLARREKFSLQQRKQLFHNLTPSTGSGQAIQFEDATSKGGAVLQIPEVSRGLAFGDLDNDGDTDVVVGNDSGPLRVLVNTVGSRKHWIGLRLVAPTGVVNPRAHGPVVRDMVGARVQVIRADGKAIWRRARADGSYASASDPRVLVGLGDATGVQKVHIIWPDGRTEDRTDIPIDRYTTITESPSK